jgi:multisubunit Na+/H+ antiporter MnhE subunit
VRRAASLLIWFAVLEGFWALLVGTQQDTELAAGLIAAAVGALLAETMRSLGLLPYTTHFRTLAKLWKAPFFVVFDFLLVTWTLVAALARRQRVRGTWVWIPFATEPESVGNWQRAFGTVLGNNYANTIITDFEGDEALVHAFAPDAITAKSVV